MDQQSLVLEKGENPGQALLPAAFSALLELGWELMAVGQRITASPGCLVCIGSACCSWGHWLLLDSSLRSMWGSMANSSWHLDCVVNAIGDMGTSVSHQRLPGHTDPGDPHFYLFPHLHDTPPFFSASPLPPWPARICLFPLVSLTAQCGVLRAPLQLLNFLKIIFLKNYQSNNSTEISENRKRGKK